MAGAMIRQAVKEAGIDNNKVLGVGISVPAHVTEDGNNITYAPILNFTGGSINAFSQFIDYPCHFINDASAACMAEYWNVNELVNIVYLSLSNSVGGPTSYLRHILNKKEFFPCRMILIQSS